MPQPAVIVLPFHNAERQLKKQVTRVLEIVCEVGAQTSVVILDDGSTDGTFEAACELAAHYPQVRVLRQPTQRGLGSALERVRRCVPAPQAIVHDGVSPLDFGELARLLKEESPAPVCDLPPTSQSGADESRGSRRFAAVTRLNEALQRAHRPLTTFRWTAAENQDSPRRVPPEVGEVVPNGPTGGPFVLN